MNLKKTVTGLIFSLAALLVPAQDADVILSQFIATPLEETVFLRWTITAGNTCQDTYVERSADGASFSRIGLIGGICGSPDESITYEFRDTLPLPNRTAYYRLQLGEWGFTSSRAVEFILYNDQGYLLAPSPFRDFTRISIPNEEQEECQLSIYSINGIKVLEMSSTQDDFIIHRQDLGPGIHLFRIEKNGETFLTGKLLPY